MGKTEVYSWRLSPELKAQLETQARRQGASVSALIEKITQDWLEAQRVGANETEAEQFRLHRTAARTFGLIAGGDPMRSERARPLIRERLERSRDRKRAH